MSNYNKGTYNKARDQEKTLTPKTALLSWLGLFNWKLMLVVIATIQAASTVITSRGARIFCMTRKIDKQNLHS